MPGATVPLGFPYPVPADSIKDALNVVLPAAINAIDDYLAALAAVGPVNWTALALGSGFAGSINYARRAGQVTVVIGVTAASWSGGANLSAALPIGFRPSIRIPSAFGSWAGSPRYWAVETTGILTADAAGTSGCFGVVSFPV